ncbi:hypothetical protein B0H13DRAFT_1918799 [Mycena leptocephala]|nr:hypothetical protein B0H13DRAFT_1918799 [Mycena leptocephala]
MSRCIEPRCSQSSTNENARPCRTLRACCPTATSSSLETHRRTPSLRSLPLRGLALLTPYILYPLPAHLPHGAPRPYRAQYSRATTPLLDRIPHTLPAIPIVHTAVPRRHRLVSPTRRRASKHAAPSLGLPLAASGNSGRLMATPQGVGYGLGYEVIKVKLKSDSSPNPTGPHGTWLKDLKIFAASPMGAPWPLLSGISSTVQIIHYIIAIDACLSCHRHSIRDVARFLDSAVPFRVQSFKGLRSRTQVNIVSFYFVTPPFWLPLALQPEWKYAARAGGLQDRTDRTIPLRRRVPDAVPPTRSIPRQ